MKVHGAGVWVLSALICVLILAAGWIEIGIGAAIVVAVIMELLMWRSIFSPRRSLRSSGDPDDDTRRHVRCTV